jgi:hypothetical protein
VDLVGPKEGPTDLFLLIFLQQRFHNQVDLVEPKVYPTGVLTHISPAFIDSQVDLVGPIVDPTETNPFDSGKNIIKTLN